MSARKYPAIHLGDFFGRWTVLSEETSPEGFSQRGSYWRCRCSCGIERIVCGGELRSGRSRSCGCSPKYNSLPAGESAFNSLINVYKWGATKRGLSWRLNKEQIRKLTQQSCFYCGLAPAQKYQNKRSPGSGIYTYNGLDRRDNQIGYTPENTVSCCKLCNLAKRTLTVKEFRVWVKRVYDYSRLDALTERGY